MKTITGITNKPNQACTLTLSDGTKARLNLYFRAAANRMVPGCELQHGHDQRPAPGELSKHSPVMAPPDSFGLAFTMPDGSDPSGQEDFSTATFLLLEQADIATVEAAAFPGL